LHFLHLEGVPFSNSFCLLEVTRPFMEGIGGVGDGTQGLSPARKVFLPTFLFVPKISTWSSSGILSSVGGQPLILGLCIFTKTLCGR
jgi:hypothetical protein